MARELKNTFIERDKLYEKMDRYVADYKVTFICAPTGYGKTITTRRWVVRENKEFEFFSVFEEDFVKKTTIPRTKKNLIVVIDDLHAMADPEDINRITNFIIKSTCKFILLSRTDLPAYLKVYYTTSQIGIITRSDMALDVNEIEKMLTNIGRNGNKKVAKKILEITKGWPVAADFLGQRMIIAGKDVKLKNITLQVENDLFEYLDYNTFSNWDRTVQIFLLNLSLFDEFSAEMATIITGKKDAELYLKGLCDLGSFLWFTPPDKFYFEPFFKRFLDDKRNERMSGDQIRYILRNAGIYYELENQFATAMKYYDMAGDTDKLLELLEMNSMKNAVDAQYFYTEKYYRKLPQEIIMQSPIFMSAMSMLESMRLRPEESEKWYDRLVEYKNSIGKSNMNYKLAKDKIAYLDIALPHRGTANIVEMVISAGKSLTGSNSVFKEIAITGNLPSILDGGKDLTVYAKNAPKVTKLIKKPGEILFGKCTIGLADAAVAESLYIMSTNLNFSDCLKHLNIALSEAVTSGTIQTQFCILGIMAKVYVADGNPELAITLMENFREKCVEENHNFLLHNIDSVLTRMALYTGKNDVVERWMETDAPKEMKGFMVSRRHQYLTKIRCYITQGRYSEAISLLTQVQLYYELYKKPYGFLETKLILAVIFFRMGDDRWKKELTEVIDSCSEKGFTRIIACEGAAVYEMLTKIEWDRDKKFFDTIVKLTREQALKYPAYMEEQKTLSVQLSGAEMDVLKLAAAGKKNSEIADFLFISESTVKFHMKNIFIKLQAKSRSMAVKVAHELGLI